MQSPNLSGEYNLTYLDANSSVVRTKNAVIAADAKIGSFTGVGGKTVHSSLILDVIESPLNGQKKLSIDAKINNFDQYAIKQGVYFYVKSAPNLSCGKGYIDARAKFIETPERNETLIPLYNALLYRDMTALINFFDETKLPYSVQMQGDRIALHYAAFFGNAKAIDYLLSKDRSIIDKIDVADEPALSYTFRSKDPESLKAILKYKPDFNLVKSKHRRGASLILDLLLNAVKYPDGFAPERLEAYLEAGLEVNAPLTYYHAGHEFKCDFDCALKRRLPPPPPLDYPICITALDAALEKQKPHGGTRLDGDPPIESYADFSAVLIKYGGKKCDDLNLTEIESKLGGQDVF
jgi:hypothetical protein